MNSDNAYDLMIGYCRFIFAITVIYGLLLLSSSRKHRQLGAAGALLSAMAEIMFCMRNDIGLIFGPLALLHFLVISIYMQFGPVKIYRIIGKVWLLLFLIFIMMYSTFRHYKPSTYARKHDFESCFSVLWLIDYAERQYYVENNMYAGNFDSLSKFTDYLCRKGEKEYCNLNYKDNFSDKCRSVSLTLTADGQFKTEAIVKGKGTCYICGTPEGINKKSYINCDDPGMSACLWKSPD